MAKRFYNKTTKKWYTAGRGMTRKMEDGRVWSGIPTEEQLAAWGYEEFVPPPPPVIEDDEVLPFDPLEE